MQSNTIRVNERENEILTKAVAKYRAKLLKETQGTNYLEYSGEMKYIDRLLMKCENNRRQFNDL